MGAVCWRERCNFRIYSRKRYFGIALQGSQLGTVYRAPGIDLNVIELLTHKTSNRRKVSNNECQF